MANYYTDFSFNIEVDAGQRQIVEHCLPELLREVGKDSTGEYWEPQLTCTIEEHGVWIRSDDGTGDVDQAADLTQRILEVARMRDPIVIGYANTCSKLRLDAFSGGAIVVYPKKMVYFDGLSLAEKEIDRYEKRKEKKNKQ